MTIIDKGVKGVLCEDMTEFVILGLDKVPDYFSRFSLHPSRVSFQGRMASVGDQGHVDLFGGVSKKGLGEKDLSTMPSSLEECQQLTHAGNGCGCLGVETEQLSSINLELDCSIPP